MRTMKLEIDGKMKDCLIFGSMWEYIEHFGATVEDYQLSPAPHEEEKWVGEFKPIDDEFFGTASADQIDIPEIAPDPKYPYYQHVNWGEDEYALIPEGELEAKFYMIWEWNEIISGYDTRGQIFQTREDAEKAMAE